MNPENSEHETVEEVMEDIIEEVVEETTEPAGTTRIFHGTGPIARFVQGDAFKPLLENDLIQSFEAWNKNVSKRLNMSSNTVSVIAFILVLLLLSLVMPVNTLHVSLAPEAIHPSGGVITNSLVMMIVIDLILFALVYMVTKFKADGSGLSYVPRGMQNFIEIAFEYLYGMIESIAGHNARRFAPWCLTLFFFIIISNWSGLIPGVGTFGVWHEYHSADAGHGDDADHSDDATHEEGDEHGEEGDEGNDGEGEGDDHGQLNGDSSMASRALGNQIAMSDGRIVFASAERVEAAPVGAGAGEKTLVPLFRPPTASLNFTFAIALMTMVIVQYYGFKKLGTGYLQKFFTFRGESISMKCINAFVGILELISELSRILTFAFRLFGNIFAGEVMLATMAFLVTFIVPVPIYFLEIFVGFVQALVFMMLAVIFFTLSEHSHGDEHH